MEPYNYIINTAQQPNFETGFALGQAMKLEEQKRQAQAAMTEMYGLLALPERIKMQAQQRSGTDRTQGY